MKKKSGSKFDNVLQAAGKAATKPVIEDKKEEPRGRPRGKRSDPDYLQISAYIRRDTHHAVKLALLQNHSDLELSDLIETLLADWLKTAK